MLCFCCLLSPAPVTCAAAGHYYIPIWVSLPREAPFLYFILLFPFCFHSLFLIYPVSKPPVKAPSECFCCFPPEQGLYYFFLQFDYNRQISRVFVIGFMLFFDCLLSPASVMCAAAGHYYIPIWASLPREAPSLFLSIFFLLFSFCILILFFPSSCKIPYL